MSGSVWVKVHPDYAGGGNGTLDPAELLSDPVAVSNATDPMSYTVKLTDGSQKKIWFLPGNDSVVDSSTSSPDATYSVRLSPGQLQGVMVAAGGQGGGRSGTAQYGGGGGAGGVIGSVCRVPVILPSDQDETYTIVVPPTGVGGDPSVYHPGDGRDCHIAIEGEFPFAAAIGGGRGTGSQTGFADSAGRGGSGGGAGSWDASADRLPGQPGYGAGGLAVPGQGHSGGGRGTASNCGGGGYGSSTTGIDGGLGFNLAAALMLDDSDGSTKSFIDMISEDGWIAGGGAASNGSVTGGGGTSGRPNGQAYTGAGGQGHASENGRGGCGMVLLVTEV
jgi:hypothetical protein